MTEIRFRTEIGDDGIIRLPVGVSIAPGPVQVVLTALRNGPAPAEPLEPLGKFLARLAEEYGDLGLPPDLAKNHDHYLHPTPGEFDPE